MGRDVSLFPLFLLTICLSKLRTRVDREINNTSYHKEMQFIYHTNKLTQVYSLGKKSTKKKNVQMINENDVAGAGMAWSRVARS